MTFVETIIQSFGGDGLCMASQTLSQMCTDLGDKIKKIYHITILWCGLLFGMNAFIEPIFVYYVFVAMVCVRLDAIKKKITSVIEWF